MPRLFLHLSALAALAAAAVLIGCPYSGYDDDDSGPEPETFVEAVAGAITYVYRAEDENLCTITYPLSYNIGAPEAPYPDGVTVALALSFDLDISSECFMSGEASSFDWPNFFDVYFALDGSDVLMWDEEQGWENYTAASVSDDGFSTWSLVSEDGGVELWEQIGVSW